MCAPIVAIWKDQKRAGSEPELSEVRDLLTLVRVMFPLQFKHCETFTHVYSWACVLL